MSLVHLRNQRGCSLLMRQGGAAGQARQGVFLVYTAVSSLFHYNNVIPVTDTSFYLKKISGYFPRKI